MKILITNIRFDNRSGTEVVTLEYAQELRRRGHLVVIYSPQLGPMAEGFQQRGGIAVDQISAVPFIPDIIHGHHNIPLAIALSRFPQVPAIFISHNANSFRDSPFKHPAIKLYLAVDELCRLQLIKDGISEENIEVLHNSVDLIKYQSKTNFHPKPLKALLLTKGKSHKRCIYDACHKAGITLDELGPGSGKVISNLSEVLPEYDIVFATARMALEAAACGCHVIVCDHRGLAGSLTSQNWSQWFPWNLGAKLLTHPIDSILLTRHIQDYDPEDLRKLVLLVREEAGLIQAIDKLEQVYGQVITKNDIDISPFQTSMTLSELMEKTMPFFHEEKVWRFKFEFITLFSKNHFSNTLRTAHRLLFQNRILQ